MTDNFQLPPASEEVHNGISQKAVTVLGGMAEGNGLKADQVRLVRHQTHIHRIPCEITVELEPEISKNQLRGRMPQGQVLGAEAEVMAHAEGEAQAFLTGKDVQHEIVQTLQRKPARGFGMQPAKIALNVTRREFSVITQCLKCNGGMYVTCNVCNSMGTVPCQSCSGNGYSQCQTCFGVGMVQDSRGNRVGCMRCQSSGRIICLTCQGQRATMCPTCQGHRQIPCIECNQSGAMTDIYQISYKARCQFHMDQRNLSVDVRKAIEKLGVENLARENHAEVFWLPLEVKPKHISIPCIACLPIAEAEISVEGKVYPAVVAGLQGLVLQIDPFLDAHVKPGISALMKLSKGPLAVQALVDTACRYKMIRQVLSGLSSASKRVVYQKLAKEYPQVISEKYAMATVRYAHMALLAISAGPRWKGLILGTLAAAAISAGYYMSKVRAAVLAIFQQHNIAQHVALADILVWAAGYATAVFIIKFMVSGSLRKMLPQNIAVARSGLPPAGTQGLWALLSTVIACVTVAFFAPEKPAWILQLLGSR